MDLRPLVGFGGIPVVEGLTEWVKRTFPGLLPRWYPTISITWGIVLNVLLALIMALDVPTAVLVGVLTGLAASKLFAWAKDREQPSAQQQMDAVLARLAAIAKADEAPHG